MTTEVFDLLLVYFILIITIFVSIGLNTLDEHGDEIWRLIYNKIIKHVDSKSEHSVNKTVHSEQKTVHSDYKTGHWIILDDIWTKCSECGIMFKDVYDFDNYDSYCRHCGVRMEGLKHE